MIRSSSVIFPGLLFQTWVIGKDGGGNLLLLPRVNQEISVAVLSHASALPIQLVNSTVQNIHMAVPGLLVLEAFLRRTVAVFCGGNSI